MDRGAWQTIVHGGHKELDMTEWLNMSMPSRETTLPDPHVLGFYHNLESYDQSRQHIQKQRHYFANKGPSSQGYGFSSSHAWMWDLVCEESWAQENWWFWTVMLEKTLESPLHCKEIKPVHPKVNQYWILIGRTDVEAETPILWPPDGKSWLIGKDPDAGKDWGREEKVTTGWDGWMSSPTQWT